MRYVYGFDAALPVLRLLFLAGHASPKQHDVACAFGHTIGEQALHTGWVFHELVKTASEGQCNESVRSTPSLLDEV